MQGEEIVRLENVSKIYGIEEYEIKAVDSVDLTICNNEYVSLMGPSGSGKTTLLDIITTMMKPTSGNVFIGNVNTFNSGKNDDVEVSFIFYSLVCIHFIII